LPFTMKAFDRLGVREKLDRTFLPKHGEKLCRRGSRGVSSTSKTVSVLGAIVLSVTAEFGNSPPARENGAEVRRNL
jgi:hypothetical protein